MFHVFADVLLIDGCWYGIFGDCLSWVALLDCFWSVLDVFSLWFALRTIEVVSLPWKIVVSNLFETTYLKPPWDEQDPTIARFSKPLLERLRPGLIEKSSFSILKSHDSTIKSFKRKNNTSTKHQHQYGLMINKSKITYVWSTNHKFTIYINNLHPHQHQQNMKHHPTSLDLDGADGMLSSPGQKSKRTMEEDLVKKKQDEAHEPECRHECWETKT